MGKARSNEKGLWKLIKVRKDIGAMEKGPKDRFGRKRQERRES